VHPIALYYHTFQIYLQSQLRLLSLYSSLFTTCFGPYAPSSGEIQYNLYFSKYNGSVAALTVLRKVYVIMYFTWRRGRNMLWIILTGIKWQESQLRLQVYLESVMIHLHYSIPTFFIYLDLLHLLGACGSVRNWLRKYAIIRKAADSIPDEDIEWFQFIQFFNRSMSLRSTQPLM
jgi:hypothetical protein